MKMMKYWIKGNYLVLKIDDLFAGKTIDEVFAYFCLSKKTIHLMKQHKQYTLNNQYVQSNTVLKDNDMLSILAYDEGIDYAYELYDLKVVYEDDFILVVDKPEKTAIYPEHKTETGTLANYVANYYLETNQFYPVRPIHRLDVDTTGLVIFCKCALLQPKLDLMLANKEINRSYIGVCQGILKKDCVIDKPIGRDRHQNRMRINMHGKKAKTRLKVIKQNKDGNYTVIACQLETGRKHQIRVHLQAINHPLLGDKLYGNESKFINRVALHAYKIAFRHPLLNQEVEVFASLPNDFKFIGTVDLKTI